MNKTKNKNNTSGDDNSDNKSWENQYEEDNDRSLAGLWGHWYAPGRPSLPHTHTNAPTDPLNSSLSAFSRVSPGY